MINLLIAGYHGFGNCGDEATLKAMTANIRQMASDVKITALSYNPEFTKTEYNIESIQRFNAVQVFNAIRKNDIILSGGGTLLQDGTSTRSLMYYLSIIKLAKLFGKKVMLYGNGIGPVKGHFNRKMIKIVVNNVDVITLREKLSEKDLRGIGVNRPEIYVTADPAFTLKSSSDEKAQEFLKREGIPIDKEIIGVCIRNWNKAFGGEDSFIKKLAHVCDCLVKKDKAILLIPMQMPRDVDISMKLIASMSERAYILQGEYSPSDILAIIGQLKAMMSMRLHSLIFSAVKRIPMIGIVYDPKVDYYLRALGMPEGGDIRNEELDEKRIFAQMIDILKNYDDWKKKLDEKTVVLERKASENDKLLYEQLNLIRKEKGEKNEV